MAILAIDQHDLDAPEPGPAGPDRQARAAALSRGTQVVLDLGDVGQARLNRAEDRLSHVEG